MTVRYEISASLDGFTTAAHPTAEEPMGPGGQILFELAFADEIGQEVLAESQRRTGASIAGRRTYDLSIPWWGADGPGGDLRTPTFIVSHDRPGDLPEGHIYTFAPSPEQALEGALEAAGEKDVDVFSASIGQQLLRSGRVDEVCIHLASVLLGSGTPLFDSGDTHIRLELIETRGGPNATHLTYAVIQT